MGLFNMPFDFGGWGSAAGGLVNLIPTQDMTNPAWSLAGFTAVAPGSINETAANSGHSFGLAATITRPAGTGIYTHSVDLVKVGTDERWIGLGLFSPGFGSGAVTFFDVLAGTVGSNSIFGGFTVVPTMTPLGGGKQRCSITVTCGGSNANLLLLDQDSTPQGTSTYQGVITDGYVVSNIVLNQVG